MLNSTKKRSVAALLAGGIAASALGIVLLGCASVPKKAGIREDPSDVWLMWPEPPLAPRIKFVRTLTSEIDLGRKVTLRESFRQFLTGEKPSVSRLYQPRDVAVSPDGKRVYVSDYAQHLVFLFDLENGKVSHVGNGKPLSRPFGLALDADENLYVVEQAAKRIRVHDREGNVLRTITHPSLVRPTDIAVDRARGRLYVADPATKSTEEHAVKIFDLEGNLIGTIGDGKGDCQGCLYFPTFVTVDGEGNVYVSSTLNARVDVFDPEGKYTKTLGGRGTNFGLFDKPKGVALDTFGNVYVVDSGWSNVQIFNPKGEVLLFFGGRGSYPGLLKNPTGIAIDSENRIYVADYLNYRVTVYELVNTEAEDSFLDPSGLTGEEG